jgi:hypothetical protein
MRLRIIEQGGSQELDLPAGSAVELGRQTDPEMTDGRAPLTVHRAADGTRRIVLAWGAEFGDFSRDHLRIESLPDGRVRVTNRSAK